MHKRKYIQIIHNMMERKMFLRIENCIKNTIRKQKTAVWTQYVLIFMVTQIACAIQYFRNNDITMVSDRIGDLATAAYLAGLDWSEIVYQTNYYGFGWKWLYFILLKNVSDPHVIYAIIQFGWTIIYSVLYTFLYSKLSKGKQEFAIFFFMIPSVAIIYSFHPISSEPTLYMAMIIFSILFIQLYETKKSRYSIYIAFWMVYMLTLHERSWVIILAFVVTVLFDSVVTKKIAVRAIPFIVSFFIAYLIKKRVVSTVIPIIWSDAEIKNTSAFSGDLFWFLDSLENFMIVVRGILSNIMALCIKTYGLFILCMVFVFLLIVNIFCKKQQWFDFYLKNQWRILLVLLSVLAVIGTMVGICIRSTRSITMDNAYGYKFYVYVRYYTPWACVGILSLLSLRKDIFLLINRKYIAILALLYFKCGIHFLNMVIPLLQEKNQLSYNLETGKNFRIYLIGLFANVAKNDVESLFYSIVIGGIVLWSLSVNKEIWTKITFCVVFILAIYNGTKGFHIQKPCYSSKQYSFYHVVEYVSQNVSISKDIYCTIGNETRVYTLQYMLKEYSLHNRYPVDADDNSLVLTWSQKDDYAKWLEKNEFNKYKVKKGIYIWCKGEKFSEEIEKALNEYVEVE